MKCPQLSTRQLLILSVLITITFIQVFGGYKISFISRAWSSVFQGTYMYSKPLLYLNTSQVSDSVQPSGFTATNTIYQNGYQTQTEKYIQTEDKVSQTHQTCPTVHIAMVFASYTETWSVYLAIKSILMHRSTKLHFHFVTDDRTKTILDAMLRTWLVPGIKTDYYALNQASENVRKTFSDSPTTNCFGSLSTKLNLHSVLPEWLKHVTVIEPTSVIKVDLFELWSATASHADRMVTLCNEKCVSYCHRDTTVLHTNTTEDVLLHAVMGLNLERIRSSLKNWTKAVESVYLCRPYATETLCNFIMCEDAYPDNSQLSNVCETVQKYDGNLLRYREVKQCKELKPIVKAPPSAKKVCDVFSWERATQRREIPFLLEYSYSSSDEYDVTLSSHLDNNRMSMIERTLKHWDGPASIAIHVTDSQVLGVIDFILKSKMLQGRKNISYHLLFKIGPSYPANAVRSLAHRHVSTPYVYLNDIDFVTSYRMYTTLKQYLQQLGNIDKIAIIIPAFETDEIELDIPRNKSQMLSRLSLNQVWQFHKKSFARGHDATNYKKWKTATEPYYIKFKDMYEPYCLLKTSVFSFDPRFVGRFHDKGSHSTELHMAGYKFLVLPDCFIIHLPHPVNAQNTQGLLKCGKQWYKEWVMEKRKQYHYRGKDVLDVF